jgi:hypothetical protein
MTLDNGPAWAGIAALVINAFTTQWREAQRHKHNADDRKEQERKAIEERAAVEEKASRERRRVMRQLRTIRPDNYCQSRGCPLASNIPPPPGQPQQLPPPPRSLSAVA